jgi:hypothetical protein
MQMIFQFLFRGKPRMGSSMAMKMILRLPDLPTGTRAGIIQRGRVLWAAALLAGLALCRAGVEFPGPAPGIAMASQTNNIFTLKNAVISESWRLTDGQLQPQQLVNRLANEMFDQSGTELFRLGLNAPRNESGVAVAVRLESKQVVVLASRAGSPWTELAAFPRAQFPGEPTRVRLGKMNLQAAAKDYSGDPGSSGKCVISGFNLAKAVAAPAEWKLEARANQAAVREYPFPAGTAFVTCRIDKGTDQGMSWSPALALIWEDGKRFLLVGVRDAKPVFNVTTADGERIIEPDLPSLPGLDLPASAFRLEGAPQCVRISPSPDGVRVADRLGGVALEADLISARGMRAHWRAELRDGSSYLRQTVRFSTTEKAVPIFAVELADVHVPEAKTIGTVPGCPVAGGGLFFGVEMPGAENALSAAGARIGFDCKLELTPDQAYTFGAVTGVAPEGQLRRAFLYYLERERARPSSPFLHYNDWYDLGFTENATNFLDAVKAFTRELTEKRGVPVQSYLMDDGWDDPQKGLWVENTNKFPGGFAALQAQMKTMNAHLAIWISPLGGYGGNAERTADAQKLGLIPAGAPLDFVYPRYKNWFQSRCLQLMREDGVDAFKWDKAGEGVSPHFMALLDIAQRLRRQNPKLFINVTVGTWPSPFWLNFVDSTWRNGSGDVGWTGKGRAPGNPFDRERWLTYRDGYCRKLFVARSPLYPLNSIMAHGIVHGRFFQGGDMAKHNPPDLKNEARSYFAIGASLEELYLTPSLLTPQAWDDVAAAARWAHANADVLVDSHWVGGDPLKSQVYGCAAWNPRQGTLMLRNPDDQPQSFTLDAQAIFELPAGAAKNYSLQSPYADQRIQNFSLEAGRPRTVTLEPFEVLVFDALPGAGKQK